MGEVCPIAARNPSASLSSTPGAARGPFDDKASFLGGVFVNHREIHADTEGQRGAHLGLHSTREGRQAVVESRLAGVSTFEAKISLRGATHTLS